VKSFPYLKHSSDSRLEPEAENNIIRPKAHRSHNNITKAFSEIALTLLTKMYSLEQ
jgi:hypothetical protein